jgi:site-specific DNA recombinase
MRAAIYARVSTPGQAKDQTIEQQLQRLRAYTERRGWSLDAGHVYLDDGYSGASLNRPGLDALRDRTAWAEFDVVLLTAPVRLARNYVHQVLLLEEL